MRRGGRTAWPLSLATTPVATALVAAALVTSALATGFAYAADSDVPARRATRPPPARRTPAVPPRNATSPEYPLDLGPATIRQAIADSRDPLDDVVMPRTATFGAGDATTRQGVDEGSGRAGIPACLARDADRSDPPRIAAFGLGGFLPVPVLHGAIATGRCP